MWNYAFWRGNLYPEHSNKHPLFYFSKQFTCVELNSTFYDKVDAHTIYNWKKNVNPSFKFCPKFSQAISHDRYLNNIESITDEFIESISHFKENLGISFLQFSPNMPTERIFLLEEFLKYINNRIQVSVEIRPEWLSQPQVLTQCLDILKEYNAGVVIVDGAETIQYLNNIKLANSTAFVRFLSYDHPTDIARINDWVKMIKLWQDKGLKEIYFILHFGKRPYVPPIIKYTKERFEKVLGLDFQ